MRPKNLVVDTGKDRGARQDATDKGVACCRFDSGTAQTASIIEALILKDISFMGCEKRGKDVANQRVVRIRRK